MAYLSRHVKKFRPTPRTAADENGDELYIDPEDHSDQIENTELLPAPEIEDTEADQAACIDNTIEHLFKLFDHQQPEVPPGDPFGRLYSYISYFREKRVEVNSQRKRILPQEHWRQLWDTWCEHCEVAFTRGEILSTSKAVWRELVDGVNARLHPPGPHRQGARLINAEEVIPKHIQFLWNPWLLYGKIAGIGGDPGVGKTYSLLAMASALSRGRIPGPLELGPRRTPQKTLWCTGEEDHEDTIVPRLIELGADLTQIKIYNGLEYDAVRFSDLGWLKEQIQDITPALLVFDPMVAFIDDTVNINQANTVKKALRPLEQLVKEAHVACVAVHYLTKDGKENALYRLQNSVIFAATFRSVMMVGQDPAFALEDDLREKIRHGVLAHSKVNYSEMGKSLSFHIDKAHGFQWTGVSSVTANQLNKPEKEDTREIDRAIDFLSEYLKKGPRPQKEVEEFGREAENLSKRTLTRGKELMKVNSKPIYTVSERDGKKTIDHWEWSLPKRHQKDR